MLYRFQQLAAKYPNVTLYVVGATLIIMPLMFTLGTRCVCRAFDATPYSGPILLRALLNFVSTPWWTGLCVFVACAGLGLTVYSIAWRRPRGK